MKNEKRKKNHSYFFYFLFLIFLFSFTGCEDDTDGATYTVTFDLNGGTGATPAAQTASAGSGITIPPGNGLSRSGYSFGGWNTNADGTGTNYSGGMSFTPSGDVTLYAKWVSVGIDVSRTITFDINGGNGTAPDPRTASSLSSITLPTGSGFSRSGYTFYGWNTSADGTGTNYNAGSSYTVNRTITLYARWVFAVTFDNNYGGGGVLNPYMVNPGDSINFPSSARSGYSFGGWNTNADGTGTSYAVNESFTPNANITFYAQWKIVYIITFDINHSKGGLSGTAPPTLQVTTGESAVIPSQGTLAIDYANFTGWNTMPGGTGTNYNAGASVTPNGNITLYAQWHITTSFASLSTFAEKLKWIQAHAENNAAYTIALNADETIDPKVFSGSNVAITLSGSGGNRTITFPSTAKEQGTLFTVNPGVTLTLDSDITLKGYKDNNDSLVKVTGGTLVMNGGAITDNCFQNSIIEVYQINGGGVYVGAGGTFTMTGGTISGNYASTNGGGVYVDAGGTFTMTGGLINHNTAMNCQGGGVYVFGVSYNGNAPGNFTKTGGTITGYSSGNSMDYNYCWNAYSGIRNNSGHAVYVRRDGGTPNPSLRRETTATPSDNLSFVNGVAGGGWEQ